MLQLHGSYKFATEPVAPVMMRDLQFVLDNANCMRHACRTGPPPGAHGALTGRGRCRLSWPLHRRFLQLELGIAVVIADLLEHRRAHGDRRL